MPNRNVVEAILPCFVELLVSKYPSKRKGKRKCSTIFYNLYASKNEPAQIWQSAATPAVNFFNYVATVDVGEKLTPPSNSAKTHETT